MLWTMGIIAVGLVVSFVVKKTTSDAPRGTEFEDYVAKLRAAGEPTTYRELRGDDPPDDVNSAPEIVAAFKGLDDTVGRDSTWKVTGPWDMKYVDDGGSWFERASPDEIRDLDEFLVRIRPFFDRVASAAEKPRCRFAFRVDEHGLLDDDGVTSMQRLTRVFSARATVDPDPAARIETCRELCVLSRRFEPVQSIGHMVRAAMTNAAVTGLRHGVETGAIDAASARTRLDPLLAPTWLDVHSRFVTCGLVQQIAEFEAMLDGRNPPSPGMVLSSSVSEIMVGWCEDARKASRWSTRPYADYLRRARMTDELARGKGELTTILIPSAARTLGFVEARCRLARIALAVAEHCAKHGDFPASLDELKALFPDGVPLDPYTDAAFVYEKTAAGVRIASAGRLAEDEPLADATLRERCIVWELKR
jgi:hypothetical protein